MSFDLHDDDYRPRRKPRSSGCLGMLLLTFGPLVLVGVALAGVLVVGAINNPPAAGQGGAAWLDSLGWLPFIVGACGIVAAIWGVVVGALCAIGLLLRRS